MRSCDKLKLLKGLSKETFGRPYNNLNSLLFSSVKNSFVQFESNKTKTMYVRTMNRPGVDIFMDAWIYQCTLYYIMSSL